MLKLIQQWWASLRAWRSQRRVEIRPPLRPSRARAEARGPHRQRAAIVYAALNSAPAGASYSQLLAHVKAQTGCSCSRRIVARWKREQRRATTTTSTAQLTVAIVATLTVAALVVGACHTSPAPPSAAPVSPSPSPLIISATADTSHSSGSPRTLMIKAQIERPEDLKVKEGEHVNTGDVLVDRRIARTPLEAQREQTRINLALMWQPRRLDTPTRPPAFYADAETAITRAAKAADDARRELDNAKARLFQMAKLERLPAAVTEHEEATRAQLEREAALAESELALARAQLTQAKAVQEHGERQNQLAIAAQRYREDEALQLAALLKTQLTAQLASLDRQIALLGEVRAPFSGIIKRIHFEEQNNNEITIILHLVLDADHRAGQRAVTK